MLSVFEPEGGASTTQKETCMSLDRCSAGQLLMFRMSSRGDFLPETFFFCGYERFLLVALHSLTVARFCPERAI